MNKLLKPYLRQVILKTHPDYFHNDVLKKQTNATSLQHLNNILQNKKPLDTTLKLDFYVKGHKNLKKTGIFNAKDSPWFIAESFFQLCKQLDIPLLQSDIDIIQDQTSKELNKHKKKFKTLSQEFADKLYQQQQQKQQRKFELDDILNNKMVMFGPSIDRQQMAKNLCTWLPDLQPEKWWGKIPLLIISSKTPLPSKQSTQGILVIKEDMNLEDIQNLFRQHFVI